MTTDFFRGVRHGIPIALGYLSVSFGFGIMAVRAGLSPLAAVMISVTNLTSAGQAAGISVISAGGTLAEMALTQFIINMRYSLMGFSLSQKLNRNFNTLHRMIASFGITDEIFAVASAQPHEISPSYMYGLISMGFFGVEFRYSFGSIGGTGITAAAHGRYGACTVRNVFGNNYSSRKKKIKRSIGGADCGGGVGALQICIFIKRRIFHYNKRCSGGCRGCRAVSRKGR